MTIATNREHLDSGSPDGCRVRGLARQVINGAGTTTALTVDQSGALCVFGTAAGQIYTLPIIGADDVGMYFEFVVTVALTAAAYSVDAAGSDKIGGGLFMVSTTPNQADFIPASIGSDVSIDLDAATTGDDGGYFKIVAAASAIWVVGGYAAGVGTMATPFA